MTEMLNKEFSRKSFVKGGGAMVVGFSLAGAGVGAKAAKAATDPYASMGPFDQIAVDSWLIDPRRQHGEPEDRQGRDGSGHARPALLMIAAEELDMSFAPDEDRSSHDTNVTPNQGVERRQPGRADGRQADPCRGRGGEERRCSTSPSTNLGVAGGEPHRRKGVVSGGGKTVTYGALIGDKLFNVDDHRLLGRRQRDHAGSGRRGLAGHEAGQPVQDRRHQPAPRRHPGQGHRQVHLRPQHPGPGHAARPRRAAARPGRLRRRHGAEVLSVDESSIKHIPGAQVVRFGNFLGVVAATEYAAIQAAAQLKVKWADAAGAAGRRATSGRACATTTAPARRRRGSRSTRGNFDSAFKSAAHKVNQTYKFHYTGHLPIGPSCCVADVTPSGARVFTNTQDAYGTRQHVKDVLDVVMGAKAPAARTGSASRTSRARASTARRRTATPTRRAAIMSALAGKPVRAPVHALGRARLGQLRPGPDDRHPRGRRREAATSPRSSSRTSASRTTRRSRPQQQVQPATAQRSRRAGPRRDDDQRRAVQRSRTGGWSGRACRCRTTTSSVSFLRAPDNPQSAFAAEQAVDELAYMAKMDPVAFRLQNVATTDEPIRTRMRWKNVLTERGEGRELAAEGGGLEPLERQRRHGPRHRVRLLLEHDDVLRRRHRGEQEDRQDRRQAAPRRGRRRPHRLPGRQREQRGRRGDAGPLARALRAGRRSTRRASRASTGSPTR